MEDMRFVQISEFRGSYPEIPLPDDIDREALGDAFFVTLPIGEIDGRSRNNRRYLRSAWEGIVEQINRDRPEGRWGHLRDDERGTRYEPPAIRWLAAVIEETTGLVWAKGLPLDDQTREHFRMAKATNARTAVSLYGSGTMQGDAVLMVQLETVDIAAPSRVGIPSAAEIPVLTAEMADSVNEEADMPTEEQLNALQQERDEARQELATLQAKLAEMESLSGRVGETEAQREEALTQLQTLREQQAEMVQNWLESAIAEQVGIATMRPLVAELVGKPASKAEAESALAAVLERESVKALMAAAIVSEMGPAISRPMNGNAEIVPGSFVIPE